jgi:hypothetical protein
VQRGVVLERERDGLARGQRDLARGTAWSHRCSVISVMRSWTPPAGAGAASSGAAAGSIAWSAVCVARRVMRADHLRAARR